MPVADRVPDPVSVKAICTKAPFLSVDTTISKFLLVPPTVAVPLEEPLGLVPDVLSVAWLQVVPESVEYLIKTHAAS